MMKRNRPGTPPREDQSERTAAPAAAAAVAATNEGALPKSDPVIQPWRKKSKTDASCEAAAIETGAAAAATAGTLAVYDPPASDIGSRAADAPRPTPTAKTSCNICLEPISEQQQIASREGDCQHLSSFCHDCLAKWCAYRHCLARSILRDPQILDCLFV